MDVASPQGYPEGVFCLLTGNLFSSFKRPLSNRKISLLTFNPPRISLLIVTEKERFFKLGEQGTERGDKKSSGEDKDDDENKGGPKGIKGPRDAIDENKIDNKSDEGGEED